jgi:HEAT repeat protein
MDEALILRVAVVEAALVAAALLVLFGHAVWIATRRRRQGPHLVGAALTLAAAGDGEAPERQALDELAGLSHSAQIGVFAGAGQSLSGIQKQRLAEVATDLGLVHKAERWCSSRRWGKRLRGARLLTLLGEGDGVVNPLLGDPRAEVRAQAAQWVADHPEPESIELLLAMLNDAETLCRFTVKDSLMRIGRPSADQLLRYMSDANGEPAVEALEVAAGIADARFLAPALELCRAADPRTRSLAAALAGSIGGDRAADALTGLLADPYADVRAVAAKALGRLAHWPATGTLAECLGDPSWEVRRAAAIALRAMGAAGVLLLRRALTDRDPFAQDMARQVLELPGDDQPAAQDSRARAVTELARAA